MTEAIRTAVVCFAVGLVTYALCGVWVRPDGLLVRLGRREEFAFVLRDADAAVHGPRPTVWLVGSSVVREAFDAVALEADVNARGLDVDVEKFALNRGAPVFSRAVLRHLPVAPGDTVITSVAEDNFVRGWLHHADELDAMVRYLLEPEDVATLPGFGVRERVDLLLAMLPPRGFQRHRDEFVRGVDAYVAAKAAGRPLTTIRNVKYQPFTVGSRQVLRSPSEIPDRVVRDDALALDATQENWAALEGLLADVRARGARAVVLVIPHHPEFARHFLEGDVTSRFDAAVDALDAVVWRLEPAAADEYADWNHPNDAGRAHFTAGLARSLVLPH